MTTEFESMRFQKSGFITRQHKGQSPIYLSTVTFNRVIPAEERKSVFTKNKREQ
jgi:hypothetical protein